MATEITFTPLVDGVLTLARVAQPVGTTIVVEEYALDREARADVDAMLAEFDHDPPELVRRYVARRIRAIGWLHLTAAA